MVYASLFDLNVPSVCTVNQIESNIVRCPDPEYAEKMISAIDVVRVKGDPVGDGHKYLKDFNNMEEAGGVGKGITRDINVDVNDSTLVSHLSWEGKGTNVVPMRGVYGPFCICYHCDSK